MKHFLVKCDAEVWIATRLRIVTITQSRAGLVSGEWLHRQLHSGSTPRLLDASWSVARPKNMEHDLMESKLGIFLQPREIHGKSSNSSGLWEHDSLISTRSFQMNHRHILTCFLPLSIFGGKLQI